MEMAFLQGLGLGGSLIVAVGAQNAFILKQGLKQSHPFFNRPQAWIYLDRAICLIMWSIAMILIAPYILAS